ncbi:MAG: lipoyl synthase [Candidatus Magnetobacterium sp. LHC-1]|uniref:Lipoyl synthase n=1 Tax=Candidatus Magnetobacterium casense TaxID=1455061 RepID=A0ABS6RUJ7_9BACT|nr:lipoyl synthase [Candidatus Magnetobacterium casensis]MBF0606478.1 lipoyl synthase [Nitrospirota bacterium]MBV6340302.1 lipoyl synthase [Candidatus Magnetobacterium casensis]
MRPKRCIAMRHPDWLKTNPFKDTRQTKQLLRGFRVNTVCEEARCPNRSHCFSKPTATFMILGNSCTRTCGFCSVNHAHTLTPEDSEPERVAQAAQSMGLRHVVITSVTRDDLDDGGARHFARTVLAVRACLPDATIEVLTPDFKGDTEALKTVLDAAPDVFNHNVETVPSLYPVVRPQAQYRRSLRMLEAARELCPQMKTKSGLMLGLGESIDECIDVLRDIAATGCNFMTIGQYLRPGKDNLPVVEYVHPDVFDRLRDSAMTMGFEFVASAPLVRSSYNAEEMTGHR